MLKVGAVGQQEKIETYNVERLSREVLKTKIAKGHLPANAYSLHALYSQSHVSSSRKKVLKRTDLLAAMKKISDGEGMLLNNGSFYRKYAIIIDYIIGRMHDRVLPLRRTSHHLCLHACC